MGQEGARGLAGCKHISADLGYYLLSYQNCSLTQAKVCSHYSTVLY